MKFFLVVFIAVYFGFVVAHDYSRFQNGWSFLHKILDFIGSLIAAIIFGTILSLLDYFLNDGLIPNYILLPLIFVGVFFMTFNSERPKPPVNFEKEVKRKKKVLKRLFNKYQPIIPDETTRDRDVSFIEQKIADQLRCFDFGDGDKISDKDLNHFNELKKTILLKFVSPKKQIAFGSSLHKILILAANTIQIRFISYSPNGKYFVCFISFKVYNSHLNEDIDKSRVMFGEKLGNEIHLYQYNVLNYTSRKDEHFYYFFTGWDGVSSLINDLDRFSLKREFKYKKYNPMEFNFWEDPNFFSEVYVDGQPYTRFKTFNLKGPQKYTSAYRLRERLILK